jgi:transposase
MTTSARVTIEPCIHCESLRAQVATRDAQIAEMRAQLRECLKLIDSQQADLRRMREEADRTRPNTPERVTREELQLAFEQVLAAQPDLAKAQANDAAIASADAKAALGRTNDSERERNSRRGKPHGRRSHIDLSTLPQKRVVIDPPDAIAENGEGWVCVGEEVSNRLAYRPATFINMVLVRRKLVRVETLSHERRIQIAELPDSLRPRSMADTSVVAHIAVSKYGDSLPLHRQERISARHGFEISRSTQGDWLVAHHQDAERVVAAMFADARASARFIATDATSAPVRAPGKCQNWHHFVFVAERDHVIFRHARDHTSETVAKMLRGYRAFVVADAALIYDTLYRDGGMIECGCWSHARRYLWRALESERARALEGLALVAKIFEADRLTANLPLAARTIERAQRAGPILDALDQWIDATKPHADPRGRLEKAIGYIENQREALRCFLRDGALPIHNNEAERQLRAPVLGRANWTAFENETGLKLYSTYRSLIASCALHDINPETYLEQMLRLVPNWPSTRVIQLAPKYWKQTLAGLDAKHRAITTAPWEVDPATLSVELKPRKRATPNAA